MRQERQDSDAALMRRVVAGETEQFAELVRRYESALRRVARSRLGRDDWSEDVVQETFLAAFKSRSTYNDQYSFRTWLWTILLNQCRGHFARRRRRPQLVSWSEDDSCDDSVSHPTDESLRPPLLELLAQERTELLEELLGRLSDVQADALRLRFFGGLTFQEIADTMHCSLGTAKNRVKWGLGRLAEMLGRRQQATADPRQALPDTDRFKLNS